MTYEQQNLPYLARVLDQLWSTVDPGMRTDPRPALERAGLIDASGQPVVEIDE